jgi:peptidoglycan/xylan/chitin deacetylase (PgdA/CDA1 family)
MRCVALTFDDGPSSSTLALISILQSKKAVATFFVVGSRVNRYQPALQQMIANNDEIGNHSFSHVSFKKISSQSVANEVNSTQNAVFVITGYRPHIVRPPDGDIPANDPTLAKYPIILWSIDPDDWKTRNTDTTYSRVMASVQPGSIIIMHDLYPATINAVPRIIDSLQQQGYVLVTISELFGWKDASVPLPIGQVLHHQQ